MGASNVFRVGEIITGAGLCVALVAMSEKVVELGFLTTLANPLGFVVAAIVGGIVGELSWQMEKSWSGFKYGYT